MVSPIHFRYAAWRVPRTSLVAHMYATEALEQVFSFSSYSLDLCVPGRFGGDQIQSLNPVLRTEVSIPLQQLHRLVPTDCRNLLVTETGLDEMTNSCVPEIVKAKVGHAKRPLMSFQALVNV